MKLKNVLSYVCFLICFFSSLTEVLAQSPRASGRPAKAISYSSGSSGVLFDVGIYYGQSQATADPVVGNEWKTSSSIYDIKLGYIREDGIYLGAEYSTYTQSTAATLSTPAVESQAGGGAGVGLGYFWNSGFHGRTFYRFNETFGEYKSGTGFQADLGYAINVTSNFYLGIMFSHRQVTFKEYALTNNFQYWTKKETYPFLTMGFKVN